MSYERQVLKIAELEINPGEWLEFYLWFNRDTLTGYAVWDSMLVHNGQQINSNAPDGANRTCSIAGRNFEARLLTTDIAVRNAYQMGEIVEV